MLQNQVQLIGRLGRNPEVKHFDGGKVKASFPIATNEYYKDAQGAKVEDVQWHNVVAWGKTAEIIEKYVQKGSEIALTGKLNSRSYDDKDGNKKYITEVVAKELRMLDKAPKN